MLGLGLYWGFRNDVLMVGKGPFEFPMQWLVPGSDKWSPVKKETLFRRFIEDVGLINLYKELGMSPIF